MWWLLLLLLLPIQEGEEGLELAKDHVGLVHAFGALDAQAKRLLQQRALDLYCGVG